MMAAPFAIMLAFWAVFFATFLEFATHGPIPYGSAEWAQECVNPGDPDPFATFHAGMVGVGTVGSFPDWIASGKARCP